MKFKEQLLYLFLSLYIAVVFINSAKTGDWLDFLIPYNFKKMAYQGVPNAQIKLGDIYYKRKQYKKALLWYKKAIKNNALSSYKHLIDIYLETKKQTEVFEKNYIHKIITEYQKLVKIDADPAKAYLIGHSKLKEDNTRTQNPEEAFKWFYKSASKNYMLAQIQIGDMYLNALGTPENQLEAIKWYKKASKHNSFFCSVCYKTDLILKKLGYIKFVKNFNQIYRY
ncbi:MAG: tetratricopeptide repeat protein [Oligoflexia bacterium]|nr:tetratricopeptide repeat protein [Oligoflexia bacterium]